MIQPIDLRGLGRSTNLTCEERDVLQGNQQYFVWEEETAIFSDSRIPASESTPGKRVYPCAAPEDCAGLDKPKMRRKITPVGNQASIIMLNLRSN